MAREQAAAQSRRRSSNTQVDQTCTTDTPRRDDEARQRYYSTRRQSPLPTWPPSSRRTTADFPYPPSPSPISARSSIHRPPIVHHHSYSPTASRSSRDPIAAHGEEVIAREQARAAHERLREAMGDLSVEDAEGEWVFDRESGEYIRVAASTRRSYGEDGRYYYEDAGGGRGREGRYT